MKNFKFFESNVQPTIGFLQLQPSARFNPENVEFCFQFDDDEPFVFATGPNECHITLNTTRDGHMTFTNNGRTFKLFARERENESHI